MVSSDGGGGGVNDPGKYLLGLEWRIRSVSFVDDGGKCDGGRDGLLADNSTLENAKNHTAKESRKSTKEKKPGERKEGDGLKQDLELLGQQMSSWVRAVTCPLFAR